MKRILLSGAAVFVLLLDWLELDDITTGLEPDFTLECGSWRMRRARYYQPGVGSFTIRDAFRGDTNSPQSMNGYYDAFANPINLTDPSRNYLKWCGPDARGQSLSFEYDALNRLTEKVNADTSQTLATYTYGSTAGSIDFRTAMSDQSGDTTWAYSNCGRTMAETRSIDSEDYTFTTVSDWLGRGLKVGEGGALLQDLSQLLLLGSRSSDEGNIAFNTPDPAKAKPRR